MAEAFHFRNSIHGFHRDDVVRYIDYLNAKHNIEINQLNAELEQFRSQSEASADATDLQEQLAAAQEINDQLQAQIAELEARLNQQVSVEEGATNWEERCHELERQLAEAKAATSPASQFHFTQELEAYRRAERAEREARERAEQVYHQANGALADATVKVDDAFAQIGDLADKVGVQLLQLQQAVTSSRQALSDAAASLYHIAPGCDK